MSLNRQEFTNAGRNMLGRANDGELLNIARIVVGEGVANLPNELWPLPALITHVMDVTITQRVDQGNGIMLIDGAFNSSQAPRAFDLRELGVMASVAGEAELLYSVANVLATGADHVDPAVESIHAFKVKILIDRATNVTITIGSSADIMGENIGAETIGPGWFAEKIANTLRFKRAIEGTGIELIDEPETVTIRTRSLEVDLDLLVTHTPVLPTHFADLPAALVYARQFAIPPERLINIRFAPGRWIHNSPVTINHPDCRRLRIMGAPQSRFQSNQVGQGARHVVNGYYDFDIVLPPAQFGQMALADCVTFHTHPNPTTTHQGYCCAAEVVALAGQGAPVVPANAVRVRPWWREGQIRANSGFDTGDLNRYNTILEFPDSDGLVIDDGNMLGLLDGIFLLSRRTVTGDPNFTVGPRGVLVGYSAGAFLGERMALSGFYRNIHLPHAGGFISGRRTFSCGATGNCLDVQTGAAAEFRESFFYWPEYYAVNVTGECTVERCYFAGSALATLYAAAGKVYATRSTYYGGMWSIQSGVRGTAVCDYPRVYERTDGTGVAVASSSSFISLINFASDRNVTSPGLNNLSNDGSLIVGAVAPGDPNIGPPIPPDTNP